jgi:hypothetical protein
MFLYTADIPASFLAKFDAPSIYSPAPPLAVRVQRIPIRPVEGVLVRLKEGLRVATPRAMIG